MKKYKNKKVIMILDNVRYHHSVNVKCDVIGTNCKLSLSQPPSSKLKKMEKGPWQNMNLDFED